VDQAKGARLKAEVFGTSHSDLQPSALELRLSYLIRGEKSVDEGILGELRRPHAHRHEALVVALKWRIEAAQHIHGPLVVGVDPGYAQ